MPLTLSISHISLRPQRGRRSKFSIVFVAIFAICTQLSASWAYAAPQSPPAGYTLDPVTRPECIFEISGEIDQSTIAYVKEQYKLKDRYAESQKGKVTACLYNRPGVWLKSPGGDVESAIAIGRFLREKDVVAIVPYGARCASACVIVLLGGIERDVTGEVGIHRPYDVGLSGSVQHSQDTYGNINTLLLSYFRDMNIPRRLLDAMNAVPPDEVSWLDADECSTLAVCGTDPAWRDYTDSQYAQRLGITKAELYKRQNLAKTLCAQDHYSTQQILCEMKIVQHGSE